MPLWKWKMSRRHRVGDRTSDTPTGREHSCQWRIDENVRLWMNSKVLLWVGHYRALCQKAERTRCQNSRTSFWHRKKGWVVEKFWAWLQGECQTDSEVCRVEYEVPNFLLCGWLACELRVIRYTPPRKNKPGSPPHELLLQPTKGDFIKPFRE